MTLVKIHVESSGSTYLFATVPYQTQEATLKENPILKNQIINLSESIYLQR